MSSCEQITTKKIFFNLKKNVFFYKQNMQSFQFTNEVNACFLL